jgi:hypothetical protein
LFGSLHISPASDCRLKASEVSDFRFLLTFQFTTIEIGYTEMTDSFVRVLDIGGMIWEGKHRYASIDAALQAAERVVIRWREENG